MQLGGWQDVFVEHLETLRSDPLIPIHLGIILFLSGLIQYICIPF